MGSRDPNSSGLLNKLSGEIADFDYDFSAEAINHPENWRDFKTRRQVPFIEDKADLEKAVSAYVAFFENKL